MNIHLINKKLQHGLLSACLLLIKIYRLCISPFFPGSCRFYPTCSSYSQQALTEHGLMKGLALSGKRICKCHPGHPGGIDLVPEKQL